MTARRLDPDGFAPADLFDHLTPATDREVTMSALSTLTAADEGREVAAQVKAGLRTPESAGDRWVELADQSHDAGESFVRAYDAAGGPR